MSPRVGLGRWHGGLYAIPGIPLVTAGTDLPQEICDAARADGFDFEDGDILVVAQKVVSKSEGATVLLSEVVPSGRAKELSAKTGRDARLCEVYLRESTEVLGTKGTMVITRHRLGFVCTNAGVDRSNVAPHDEGRVVLLPQDPDASAQRIRAKIEDVSGKRVAVVVSDSFGKPDRDGAIGVAIGIAGIRHLEVGTGVDLFGNPANPWRLLVDELAGSASMLMGETDERRPVVVIRGIPYTAAEESTIRDLLTS